jgi:hypothetical protein
VEQTPTADGIRNGAAKWRGRIVVGRVGETREQPGGHLHTSAADGCRHVRVDSPDVRQPGDEGGRGTDRVAGSPQPRDGHGGEDDLVHEPTHRLGGREAELAARLPANVDRSSRHPRSEAEQARLPLYFFKQSPAGLNPFAMASCAVAKTAVHRLQL